MDTVYNIYSNGELFNYLSTNLIRFLSTQTNTFTLFRDYYVGIFVVMAAISIIYLYAKNSNFQEEIFSVRDGFFKNKLVSLFLFYFFIFFALSPVKAQFVTLAKNPDLNSYEVMFKPVKSSYVTGETIYNDDETFYIPFFMAAVYSLPARIIQGIPTYNEGPLQSDQLYPTEKPSIYAILNYFSDNAMVETDIFKANKMYKQYSELFKENSDTIENLDESMNYLFKFQALFGTSVYEEFLRERERYKRVGTSEETYYRQANKDLIAEGDGPTTFLGDRDFSLLQTIAFNTDFGRNLNERAEFASNGTTVDDLRITLNALFPAIARYKFVSDHSTMLDSSDNNDMLYDFTDKLLQGEDVADDPYFKLLTQAAGGPGADKIAYQKFYDQIMTPFDSSSVDSNIAKKNKNYLENFHGRNKLLLLSKFEKRNIRNDFLLMTLINAVDDHYQVDYTEAPYENGDTDYAHCLGKQGTIDPDIKTGCEDFKLMFTDTEWIKENKEDSNGNKKHLTDREDANLDFDYGLPKITTPTLGFNSLKPIMALEDNQHNFDTILKLAYMNYHGIEGNLDFLNQVYKPLTDNMYLDFVFLNRESPVYKLLFEIKSKGEDNYISSDALKSINLNFTGICDTTSCPDGQFDYFKPNFTEFEDRDGLQKIVNFQGIDPEKPMAFELKKLEYLISILRNEEAKYRENLPNIKQPKPIEDYLKYRAAINLLESYRDFFKSLGVNYDFSSNELKITTYEQYRNYINIIEMTNIYMKDSLTYEYSINGIPSDYTEPLKFHTAIMYKPLLITAIFDSMSYLEFKKTDNIEESFGEIFDFFAPKDQESFVNRFGYITFSSEKEEFGDPIISFSKDEFRTNNYDSYDKESLKALALRNFISNIHNASKKNQSSLVSSYIDITGNINKANNILADLVSLSGMPFNFVFSMEPEKLEDDSSSKASQNLTANYLGSISAYHNNPFQNENEIYRLNNILELTAMSDPESKYYAAALGSMNLFELNKVLDINLDKNMYGLRAYPQNIVDVYQVAYSLSKNSSVEDLKLLRKGLKGSLFNKDYAIMAFYYAGEALTYLVPGTLFVKGLKVASKAKTIISSAKRATALIKESKAFRKSQKILSKANKVRRNFKARKLKKMRKAKARMISRGSKGFGVGYGFKSFLKGLLDMVKEVLYFMISAVFVTLMIWLANFLKVLKFFWSDLLIPLVFHKIKVLWVLIVIAASYVKTLFKGSSSDSINKLLYLSFLSEFKAVFALTMLFTLFLFAFLTLSKIIFSYIVEFSLLGFVMSPFSINGYLSILAYIIIFNAMLLIIKVFKLNKLVEQFSIQNALKKLKGN